MGKPAARRNDPVAHPLPPVLTGAGSQNVIIGRLPAWRGIPKGAAASVQSQKNASDKELNAAKAATIASGNSPAAKQEEEKKQRNQAASMGQTILDSVKRAATAKGGIPDIHNCATPMPIPPHGPGVVLNGSTTVMINGLPACRQGDTITEAIGPPNKITGGCMNVLIGG